MHPIFKKKMAALKFKAILAENISDGYACLSVIHKFYLQGGIPTQQLKFLESEFLNLIEDHEKEHLEVEAELILIESQIEDIKDDIY